MKSSAAEARNLAKISTKLILAYELFSGLYLTLTVT